ncbi:MAG: accessory Sec system translocase SecA2 [Acidobacteriota bacterium]|nr:accessory Sec system translocase SecA2 [Acidobacteriota bacterium]
MSQSDVVPRRPKRTKNALDKIVANPVETDLFLYLRAVARIKFLDLRQETDSALQVRAARLRDVAASRPDGLLTADFPPGESAVEAFALVREASRRALKLDPFDVQMIAGLAMARGRIAELPTGEGKTLAAVFAAFAHALSGRGVHVLTFNDYLARRDADWMGPVFRRLGLSVGCVQEGQAPAVKRAAYESDVTYATAKEAGFDFLRDRLAENPAGLVHRPFHFALIDEADSILVDEARIPLVISGAEDRVTWDAARLAAVVRRLVPGRDYETDDEHRNVFLTDAGQTAAESGLGMAGLYAPENQTLLEALYCALHAESLLRRDIDYIVRDGRIAIIDEFTGRVVEKRLWPDGLQAAVEAKEGLQRRTEGRILGSITLQHFFRLYPRLAGMTATARSAAAELREFYDLNTVIVPPHVPSRRADLPDAVFSHRDAKRRALIEEVAAVHAARRPVLVGTASVKESEELAAGLRAVGIPCAVLNARADEKEAAVIAEAGRPGAVTISTNMAGRGTDIRLGGADERERAEAVSLGGLYVIGTNRHESPRIDRQLRGRAGRQGDPGQTRFFISLEDDLFERYGLTKMFRARHRIVPSGDPIGTDPIRREIEHAQRVIEGQNFDIRRQLAGYATLIELQRRIVQERRDALLHGEPAEGMPPASSGEPVAGGEPWPLGRLRESEPALYERGTARFGRAVLARIERRAALYHLDRTWSDHLAWVQDTRDSIHLVKLGGKTPIDEFRRQATEEFLGLRERVAGAVADETAAFIRSGGTEEAFAERLKGPSSTWTYLVNDDQVSWGMGMAGFRNIGFASIAAGPLSPLFLLTILVGRFFRRKSKTATPPAAGTPEGQ